MQVIHVGSMTDYLVNPLKQTPSTLAQQIAWKHSKEEFVDRTRCSLLTCLDIAEALKFMHKSNTLHGDLKPHNILLVSDIQVRLNSFWRALCPQCGHSFLEKRWSRSINKKRHLEAQRLWIRFKEAQLH